MKTATLLIAAANFALGAVLGAADRPAPMPQPGQAAPPVVAATQDGTPWRLADALGRRAVLLYFYPKDDTPGCTRQACGWRDRMDALQRAGVEVVGVSFDSAASHKTFAEKHRLNFKLLADPDGKLADAYGVRAGPDRQLARRVSFLINRQGRIAHVTDSPDPAVHLAEMQAAIEKLEKK